MTRAIACVMLLALPMTARAQSGEAPAPQAHHVQIMAGVLWVGGANLGSRDANLRSNAPGSLPPSFILFNAATEMKTAPGFEARAGFALTPTWSIEGGASYATPQLVSSISSDQERAGTLAVTEETEHFAFDVNVLWRTPVHVGGRFRPYLTTGGGYLRELHEDRVLLATGQRFFVGGGGEWWLRGGHGRGKTLSLRAEVRSVFRTGGITVSGAAGEGRGSAEFLALSAFGVP